MTNTTRALIFREENGETRFAFATTNPTYRAGTGVCLQITHGSDSFPLAELDGNELEELHQFTHELLAGPATWRLDGVADAEIMCGAYADSPHDGHLQCALPDGHRRVGDFDHVNRRGIVFDTPGAF